MSLRIEQYRAMERLRDLGRALLDPEKTPRVPLAIRREAASCLRHYPMLHKGGRPMFSADNSAEKPL